MCIIQKRHRKMGSYEWDMVSLKMNASTTGGSCYSFPTNINPSINPSIHRSIDQSNLIQSNPIQSNPIQSNPINQSINQSINQPINDNQFDYMIVSTLSLNKHLGIPQYHCSHIAVSMLFPQNCRFSPETRSQGPSGCISVNWDLQHGMSPTM